MKKQCFKCGRVLDIEEFYMHRGMKDGHLGKCKECTKHDSFIRSRQKVDQIREYEKVRSQTEKRKQNMRLYTKKYKQKHPERTAIMLRVQRAIRSGMLKRPECCSICGKKTRIYAHHSDYSKPLDVIFVCQSCHKRIHAGTLKKDVE